MILFRYTISHLYHESKVQGLHPRETFNYSFDILSPTSGRWNWTLFGFVLRHYVYFSHLPDAEIIYIVSEVISELHGLLQVHQYVFTAYLFTWIVFQEQQFVIWLNHTSLLTAILSFCSIQPEEHAVVQKVLHRLIVRYFQVQYLLLFDLLCACMHLDWFG